ncbi:hypothetical protein CHCC15136_4080 [Bacillus paralicheniformis]|nr:hypothetical protein CHCC15136_4080 [Bacillus paralicheniformis]
MYEEENLTGGLYVFSYKKSNERNSLIALTNKMPMILTTR